MLQKLRDRWQLRYRRIVWEPRGEGEYASLYVSRFFVVYFWRNGAVHIEIGRKYFRFREPE